MSTSDELLTKLRNLGVKSAAISYEKAGPKVTHLEFFQEAPEVTMERILAAAGLNQVATKDEFSEMKAEDSDIRFHSA